MDASTLGSYYSMNKNNKFSKIAVVGMGALFAGARNLSEFWGNVLAGKDCIEQVPEAFWNYQDYYAADPFTRDKTYCKRGGFLPSVQFDCLEFGIPPSVMESISLNQLLALKVAKDALIDARLLGNNQIKYDKNRTGVILGANLGGSAFPLRERITLPKRMQDMLSKYGVDDSVINKVVGDIQDGYIDWNENSFPGFLTNIVSGRIVNRFDFGGPNFTVDAACASSLCAMMQAMYELQSGNCDAVLTGGVNVSNDPLAYLSFSKTPALSLKNNIRPYDKAADGMLVGDGIGMMVLMRLEDAEASGQRIYAVIAGLGSASDGKAKSIYAPRMEGQLLALQRAYENSDISPAQISLMEGHGTGTPVGDLCEIKTLKQFFGQQALPNESIALGSVKSQIGHTTQAAGAASAIKMALALHHKVLPPTINVEQPNPDYQLEKSPFYLNVAPVPWVHDRPHRRCAAVSSFGFGGINYHLLLEEYVPATVQPWQRVNALPHLVLLAAEDNTQLQAKCQSMLDRVNALTELESEASVVDAFCSRQIPAAYCRVGFVAEDRAVLRDKLSKILPLLADTSKAQWQLPAGIFYRRSAVNADAKLVVMFSGQGAQYPEMGKSLALNFPEMHAAFAEVDQQLLAQGRPSLTSLLFPSGWDLSQRDAEQTRLNRTEHVQPALAAFCAGAYGILANRGFKPDFLLGHSFGELTALWAAGSLSRKELFRLSIARGQAMQASKDASGDPGAMLAVAKPPADLKQLLAAVSGVQIANLNSPEQVVLSGSTAGIARVAEQLGERNLKVVRLPVSGAFHSAHMRNAVQEFAKALQQTEFNAPALPVYANMSAEPHSANTHFQTLLAAHLESPVLFQQSIESAYRDGGRIFLEIGPKSILTSFAEASLRGKDAHLVSLNPAPKKDAVLQLLEAIAQLQVLGVAMADDPYRRPAEPATAPGKGKAGVVVTLQGRHYFTPESLERINRAGSAFGVGSSLTEAAAEPKTAQPKRPALAALMAKTKTSMSEEKVMLEPSQTAIAAVMPARELAPPMPQPVAPAPAVLSLSGGLSVNDVLHCQTANSQVQNMFYQTQAQQMDVLEKLIQHQNGVMQQLANSGAVSSQQVENISLQHAHSFEVLCQHSQNMFATHDAFLSNQNAILARLLGGEAVGLRQAQVQVAAPVARPAAPAAINAQPAVIQQTTVQPVRPVSAPAPAPVVAMPPPTPVQPVANVAVPTATKPMDADQFVATLLQVVSDATGYPTDVIDLEMNLEADLGIDSIKRVEIFSSLNEKYPDYADRIDIADLAGLTSLQEILDYFAKLAPGQTGSVPAVAAPSSIPIQASVTTATGSSAGISMENFTELLLNTIVNATGYPADVIDFEMDLEADLGVDSIKRVEMFSALQEQYEDLIKDLDPSDLMELKTLQQIIDFFAQRFQGEQSVSSVGAVAAEPATNDDVVETASALQQGGNAQRKKP